MTRDQDALLRAIHDAHGLAVLRYIQRLTGNHETAEDVVQEALFRLWKHPSLLEESETSVRRWLFTVARNLVTDDWRSARNIHEIITETLPEIISPDATDAALDAWLLSEALLSLSLEHRTAIVGAYYLGHSVAEIARQQSVPEGTIKSRLHYALRALRLALQERGVTQ